MIHNSCCVSHGLTNQVKNHPFDKKYICLNTSPLHNIAFSKSFHLNVICTYQVQKSFKHMLVDWCEISGGDGYFHWRETYYGLWIGLDSLKLKCRNNVFVLLCIYFFTNTVFHFIGSSGDQTSGQVTTKTT